MRMAALLFLALLGLRQDLANLAVWWGNARLQVGDVAGAKTAYARAIEFGHAGAPLAFNLGVGLFRQGNYLQARARFTEAAVALPAAASYNRGNSEYHLAITAANTEAARQFLREAVADYERTLALEAKAVDAADNRRLALARIVALDAALIRPGSGAKVNASGKATAAEPSQTSQTRGSTTKAARLAAADSGKEHRDLSRNAAQRLLSEARARERLAGSAARAPSPSLAPQRDW